MSRSGNRDAASVRLGGSRSSDLRFAERQVANSSVLADWLGSGSDDLLTVAVQSAIEAQHSQKTNRNYDYWFDRLTEWCGNPAARYRDKDKPGFDVELLFPITGQSEAIILRWLSDTMLGPPDPDIPEDEDDHDAVVAYKEALRLRRSWEAREVNEVNRRGPISPSTVQAIIAALKARSTRYQDRRWEPTERCRAAIKGLRRKSSEYFGAPVRAEPVLADQLVGLCEYLTAQSDPRRLRDSLVFELALIGLSSAEIARLKADSLVQAGQVEANDRCRSGSDAMDESLRGRHLVVPGQRRRGGRQDPPRVFDLAEHQDLCAAIDAWLAIRKAVGNRLLFDELANPRDSVRKSLMRTLDSLGVSGASVSQLGTSEIVAARRRFHERELTGEAIRRQRRLVSYLVGWNAALRRSELRALRIGDVEFRDANRGVLWIRRSKTDQAGTGAKLLLTNPEDPNACIQTVTLLRQWIESLQSLGATRETWLFPGISKDGSLLLDEDGDVRGLDTQLWAETLRADCVAAGVWGEATGENKTRYAGVRGHSLRRGFVTQCALRGIDPITISKVTRHKNVQMIATYCSEVLAMEAQWQKYLFGGDVLEGPNRH